MKQKSNRFFSQNFDSKQHSSNELLEVPVLLEKIDNYYLNNQVNDIIKTYKKILKIIPEHAEYAAIFTNMACFYELQKKYVQAEEYFKKSLKLKIDIRNLFYYGLFLFKQGKFPDAIKYLEGALDTNEYLIASFGPIEKTSFDEVLQKLIDNNNELNLSYTTLTYYYLSNSILNLKK